MPAAQEFPRKQQENAISAVGYATGKTLRNVMVNLPPDQNERREFASRFSLLSELLAVVPLALPGLSVPILWW